MAPPKFMGLSGRALSLVISTVATTGFLLFGYDQGVMSGIITAPAFSDVFTETKDNPTMQGFVTAIYEVGCLAGAMTILAIGDLLGRRRAIMSGAFIMVLGVIIQITAFPGSSPFAQLVIGRIVMGIGNGMNTSTIPTYQAECSKTTNRGLLICIEGGVIAFGTLIAYWIDYGASYGPDDLVWRFPIAFQIIFAVFITGPMVIAAIRGYEVDSEETVLERELILDSLRAAGNFGKKSTPIKALFTNGKTQHLRRMLLGRVGRRRLFLAGSVGQCLSMVITFACLIPGGRMAARGAAVGLFTYIAFFGATWLPLPWLYPAEVNPVKTRGKANAVSTCTNWLFNFLVVMVTPIMIDNIGWGTYLFFAAVNACFIPLIYLFYPETARRSLEEIDIIFAKGHVEQISYVRAAKELPPLRPVEIHEYALRYGLVDSDAGAIPAVAGAGAAAAHDEEKPTAVAAGPSSPSSSSSTNEGNAAVVVNEHGVESGLGDGIKASEKADRD
ncbi:hypothetical protein VTH82DRAFT_3281 [Thermothelomyces myriococcoides]